MFAVKFLFMEYAPYIPMHFIGCCNNGFGNFCTGRFNYCNSLLQYFAILRFIMCANYCFHIQN